MEVSVVIAVLGQAPHLPVAVPGDQSPSLWAEDPFSVHPAPPTVILCKLGSVQCLPLLTHCLAHHL